MNLWHTVLLVVHIIAALGIIVLVLLQQGKGADMGAAFGGGSSGSLFGATGSANFLSRSTATLAVIFFLTSLGLAYVATSKPTSSGSVMDAAPVPTVPAPVNEVPQPGDVPQPSGAAQPAAPAGAEGSQADQVPK
ncbi:MAG TPA: preprotein translocase subunit SecG [Burkholderiales bacterium]|jgi:protein translocase, SecG subunit